ncbi:Rpn family recombination-promoting nuclease/putative transposase, partial [Schinkia azotoformans]
MKIGKSPNHFQWLRPKNDFIFKLLLGSEDKTSRELLIYFLNDLFQVPKNQSLSNVHLQNPHLNKQHLSDKASILDIRAQIPGTGVINIEMQVENQYNMDKRTLFYCAKVIADQLDEGENYKKLRKTTTINLLDFNYFNHPTYHSIYHLTEKKTGTSYPDILQLHFIEMKRFKKLHRNGKINPDDRLAKWIEFFANEDDSQWKIIASKDPIIKKAVDRLEIISQNQENRWDYEIRQKALKDITTMKEGAKEEGKAEGKAEGKIEVALEMLRDGLDVDRIAKLTGF